MITFKQGDTKDPVHVRLLDDGEPIDLTNCSVTFHMSNGVTGDAEIRDQLNGEVWYVFDEGETDDVGIHRAEFVVKYPDFREQTFPQHDYL